MATITICDVCGSRDNVKRRYFEYDRQMTPAGDTDGVGETFDLCDMHYANALEHTINGLVGFSPEIAIHKYDLNKRIVKSIRNSIDKHKHLRSQ